MLKLHERRHPQTRALSESVIPELTGRIIKWDPEKRYGFLHTGDRRVFLHIRDFAERHKQPKPGDRIRFTMGKDDKGRPCARSAVHVHDGGRITSASLLVVCGLLILPVYALYETGLEPLWVATCLLVINAITYWQYADDKQRARKKDWRVSEASLHILEFLGGWPAAWLAQRRFRHKCSKGSYQFTFWLIVIAWQIVAYDSLQDWMLLTEMRTWLPA